MKDEFHKHPENYLSIDEIGDLHIQWFYNKYAALRLKSVLPIFERAYELLTERGNFSRKNAFGEMHCEGYLWIEKHDEIKVIVEERQSYSNIYIYDGYSFHIRALDFATNYPQHRKNELKNIKLKGFIEQGFKPFCPNDYNIKTFDAFTYGDSRDDGYIVSVSGLYKSNEMPEEIRKMFKNLISCDYADSRTLYMLDSLNFWTHYLDNPDDLE